MAKDCLALVILLSLSSVTRASPKDAVIRVTSHGGSGTVIATGPGWSVVLSAAHMFGPRERGKPLAFDIPLPAGWTPLVATGPAQVLGVGSMHRSGDLAVLLCRWGPAPYIAPVAPSGWQPDGVCLSVGYDEQKKHPTVRPATIQRSDTLTTYTRERPWHGRSGGALLSGPYLVGVVSAYSGPPTHDPKRDPQRRNEVWPGANGSYASHAAILAFLARTPGLPPGVVGAKPQEQGEWNPNPPPNLRYRIGDQPRPPIIQEWPGGMPPFAPRPQAQPYYQLSPLWCPPSG